MGIHWVLETQPVGGRGFVAESADEAARMCKEKQEYPASFCLTQIRTGVVTLTKLKVDREVRLGKADLVRLLRALRPHGITAMFYERQLGRLGPCAEPVMEGPLAGMFYVDVVKVLAGMGGDY